MARILKFETVDEFKDFLLKQIKVDPRGIKFLKNKYQTLYFYFKNIPNHTCNIIKQEMLACGGEAAVSKEVAQFKQGKSNILIYGTRKAIQKFIEKSEHQIKSVADISNQIKEALSTYESIPELEISRTKFDFKNKVYIMGVLNLTPDSFYDGGRYLDKEKAIQQALAMVKEGADIIDIGGESTRPGAEKISVKEEINRVIPVLKAIRKEIKIPISVDTYKSETAEAALIEGADIVNDISGLRFDKKMAKIIARYNAGVVVMHIKGTPKTMQLNPVYEDLVSEIKEHLEKSIKIALENGINFNKIIIDPGIGFGKRLEDNYVIINKLEEFKIFGRPILIGLSRKSLIGKVLNQTPEERLPGTLVLNAISILNGANIIRVHDVEEHKKMIKLVGFLKNKGVY